MQTNHVAVRDNDGTWRIDQIYRQPRQFRPRRHIGWLGQFRRKTIAQGLGMDEAIARAAELNGSRAMRERQTVKPRHRVGIRSGK